MKLSSIQALRFFAAMLVVAMHATQAIADNIHQLGQHTYWDRGSTGVHIFFVISGFVMHLTAPDDSSLPGAWHFLKKRIIRVAPLYWIYTILKVALIFAATHQAISLATPDISDIAKSLFFIPHLDAHGNPFPILQVGWTLNYEMLFYLIFSLAIAINRKHRLAAISAAIILVFVVGNTSSPQSPAGFYGRGILFEFILGIVGGMLYKRNAVPNKVISAALALLSLCALFLTPPQPDIDSFFTAGIPSFLLVISCLSLQRIESINNFFKSLSPLGDASYSLYLAHPFSIAIVSRLLAKSNTPDWISFITLCATSILISWWSYKAIEVPISSALASKSRRPINEHAPL